MSEKGFLPRVSVLIICIVLYVVFFAVIYYTSGHGMGAATILPVIVAGWLFGLRAGVLCGVCMLPVTCLLCILMRVPDWVTKVLIDAMPGYIGLVIVGGIVGYIHDLRLRLQEEFDEKMRAQSALQMTEEHFHAIAESTPDAVITVDSNSRITYWNKGASTIFGYAPEEILKKPVLDLLPEFVRNDEEKRVRNFVEHSAAGFIGKTFETVGLRKNGSQFPLEQSLAVWETGGERYFSCIIRDITGRKEEEKERENLISDLQRALTEVKELSGLLPICASCKKIRDDKGYWNQIEGYIQTHSKAQFSHSICPSCARKLYPGLSPTYTKEHS